MTSPQFLRWCSDNGVLMGHIQAAEFDGEGRGIQATTDIKSGEILLQVPKDVLISRASAEKDSKLGPLLQQHTPSPDSYQVLAVHLLHEVDKAAKGSRTCASNESACDERESSSAPNSSFWQPYLAELPRSYSTLSSFTASDVSALQVPYAQEAGQAAADKARQKWKGAVTLLKACDDEAGCLTPFGDLFNYAPPPGPHTLDVLDEEREAGDAESAARKDVELPTHLQSLPHISLSELPAPCHQPSRETQPSPPVSTVLLPPVSIPVLHHQTSLSSPQEPCDSQGSPEVLCGDGSYDERCGMYKLYARRSYTAGDQVYLCYGHYNNLQLLELYGFMLEHNPHDEAFLPKGAFEAAMAGELSSKASKGGLAKEGLGNQLVNKISRITTTSTTSTTAVPTTITTENSKRQSSTSPTQQQQPSLPHSNQKPFYSDHAPSLSQLPPCDCFLHANGSPSWALLQALRTAASTPHERKIYADKLASNQRVSRSGDLRVTGWLLDASLLQLSSLPSSISEDKDLLHHLYQERNGLNGISSLKGPTCLELAVQWRLRYKRTLMLGVQRSLHALDVLSRS